MRQFLPLLLLVVGCAQLRYSGRFQEVLVNSDPPGAAVSVEGLTPLSSIVAIKQNKQFLLPSSQAFLTTPIKLVLDKERTYTVRIRYEGEQKTVKLKAHFTFHPYLIILFPIVPFVIDYDVKRFDNIFVRFGKEQEKQRQRKKAGKEKQESHKRSSLKQPAPKSGEKGSSQKRDNKNKKKSAVSPKVSAPSKKQNEKSGRNKPSVKESQSEPVKKEGK